MARENRTIFPSLPAHLQVPSAYWMLVAGFTICCSGWVVVPFLSLCLCASSTSARRTQPRSAPAFGAGWAVDEPRTTEPPAVTVGGLTHARAAAGRSIPHHPHPSACE